MAKPDKREEILTATKKLIAEQGFHGAPMAMIAARAGVAAGTIYCYFDSRDILIKELYCEIEQRVSDALHEEYTHELPIRERFMYFSSKLLKYFIANPLDFRYVEQFHNSPYGAEYRRNNILCSKNEGCDDFHILFNQGVAQQLIKNLPLPVLFALSFGPLMAVMRDHIQNVVNLNEELIEPIAAACWDAVKR